MTTSMTERMNNISHLGMSDPVTATEIERLVLGKEKPLIICDVDEVLLHFLQGLENHLAQQGCWLDPASFALTGNVRSTETNIPVSQTRVGELLFGFFAEGSHEMDPIEGARDALLELSVTCDIVLLTNIPRDYLEQRKTNLLDEGFDFPLVFNQGGKGAAVIQINKLGGRPSFFIDDSPKNIQSVAESAPETVLIHFMQDDRFRKVMPELPEAALQAAHWSHMKSFIDQHLDQI